MAVSRPPMQKCHFQYPLPVQKMAFIPLHDFKSNRPKGVFTNKAQGLLNPSFCRDKFWYTHPLTRVTKIGAPPPPYSSDKKRCTPPYIKV